MQEENKKGKMKNNIFSQKKIREEKNNKYSKGITLVSLVVTIVVLIILAGISLNLTLGENGLFTMAKKAKENIELAQIEEQTRMNELYDELEQGGYYENPEIGELEGTIDDLNKTIKSLEDQLEGAKQEKQGLQENIQELNGEIDNLHGQVNQQKTEIEEKETKINELTSQVEEDKASIEEKERKIEDLNKQVAQGETNLQEKQKEITNLTSQVEEAKANIQNKQEEIDDLKSKKSELEQQVAANEATIQSKESQINSLNEQIKTKDTQIANQEQQITQLESQVAQLSTQVGELSSKMDKLSTGRWNINEISKSGTFNKDSQDVGPYQGYWQLATVTIPANSYYNLTFETECQYYRGDQFLLVTDKFGSAPACSTEGSWVFCGTTKSGYTSDYEGTIECYWKDDGTGTCNSMCFYITGFAISPKVD